MMRVHVKKSCPCWNVLVFLFLVSLVMPVMAAEDAGYSLLLQPSPVDGGSIAPGNGVHKVQIGDQIKVVAVPRTGYRFLYWIGDVGEVGTAQTTVQMNSPKLVVAVFEREQFEDLPDVIMGGGSSVGGLHASSGSSNSGSGFYSSSAAPDYYYGDSSTTEDDDGGTETPEPTTLLLLGLGTLATRIRCQKQ
ncbi:MAG: PEP-CTERM sorting domain-containing protein [Anaerohalosphaeraceae bacterium]